MNFDTPIWSIVRHILSAIGGYLVLKGYVDDSILQQGIGTIFGIIAIVGSIISKTANNDMVLGTLRQIVTFVGGYLAAKGIINQQTVDTIVGLLTALIPLITGHLTPKAVVASADKQAETLKLNGKLYTMDPAATSVAAKAGKYGLKRSA